VSFGVWGVRRVVWGVRCVVWGEAAGHRPHCAMYCWKVGGVPRLVDWAQQRLDHGGGAVHLLVGVPSDQHVQVFVLMRVVLARIAARPLLHRPLAAQQGQGAEAQGCKV